MGVPGFDGAREQISYASMPPLKGHNQITDKVVSIHPAAIAALFARKAVA